MTTQKFPVKPNRFLFLGCGVFFGVCAWVLYGQIFEKTEVYIFHRMIHLTAEQAPYFFGVLAVFSSLLSAMGFFVLVTAMLSREQKFVEITDDEIVIPAYGLASRKRIRFSNVVSLKEVRVSGTHTLEMKTEIEKAAINNRQFGDKNVYEQIKQIVVGRCTNLKS